VQADPIYPDGVARITVPGYERNCSEVSIWDEITARRSGVLMRLGATITGRVATIFAGTGAKVPKSFGLEWRVAEEVVGCQGIG